MIKLDMIINNKDNSNFHLKDNIHLLVTVDN